MSTIKDPVCRTIFQHWNIVAQKCEQIGELTAFQDGKVCRSATDKFGFKNLVSEILKDFANQPNVAFSWKTVLELLSVSKFFNKMFNLLIEKDVSFQHCSKYVNVNIIGYIKFKVPKRQKERREPRKGFSKQDLQDFHTKSSHKK